MNFLEKYKKYKKKYIQLKKKTYKMFGGNMQEFFQKNFPNEKMICYNKLDQAGFAKVYAVTSVESKIPTKTYVIKAAHGVGQDCKWNCNSWKIKTRWQMSSTYFMSDQTITNHIKSLRPILLYSYRVSRRL